MENRNALERSIVSHKIPKQTIAGLIGTAPTNVSLFLNGGSVSERMETRIGDAIRDIVRMKEKFSNIPLDLSNIYAMKRLLREQPSLYSLMVQTDPAQYFVRKGDRVYTTAFFLSSGVFHLPIARAIKEDLSAPGFVPMIVGNPYASIDSVGFLEDCEDPRVTTQYRNAMGLPLVQSEPAEQQ